MAKIDSSNWKRFQLSGDEGLFEIVKGKRLTKANMNDGTINFIGSSAENNGVTNHISNRENIHPGNLITVSYNGSVGEAFYQENEFVASDDVNVLYPRFDLNQYNALFLCSVIRTVGKKYAFINKWKKEDMEKEWLFLPATADGNPDWKYMETYIKHLIKYAGDTIDRLEIVNSCEGEKIDTSKWKEFPITDFFTLSLPKGDLQVKKIEDGDVPLITPSNYNNGLLQNISSTSPSTLYKGNSLTVDMFGNAYFQEKDYFVTAHGHVNVLIPKINMNKYIGWFMATSIKAMFANKYHFADMCTQKVLKKEVINLPVSMDETPDWVYMEKYMKEIEKKAKTKIDILCS